MKLPLVLKVFATLCFLSVAREAWELIVIARDHTTDIPMWRAFYAVFNIIVFTWLGVGLLRLRPAARIVALITCWLTFAYLALVPIAWVIWGQVTIEQPLITLPLCLGVIAITIWFYVSLRRPEIRTLFHTRGAATRSV